MIRKSKKESVLAFISQAAEPVDVEKIRVQCGIGNWNTALNYSLELLAEGKVKGQKTSKGWIFWTNQKTELKPYEEAIGDFESLQIGENEVTLILNVNKKLHLTFPAQSPEANILITKLKDVKKGAKIALLRTDIPTKPLIIKTLNESMKTINPALIIDKSPEILQKEIQNKEAPKNKQKKQAPTTDLDPPRWRLILGSFVTFLNFVKIRGIFG